MHTCDQTLALGVNGAVARSSGTVGAAMLLSGLLLTTSMLLTGGALASNPNAWPRVGFSEEGERAPRVYQPRRTYDEDEARPQRRYRRSARRARQARRTRTASRKRAAIVAQRRAKPAAVKAPKLAKAAPPPLTAQELAMRALTAQHFTDLPPATASPSEPLDVVVGPQCRGVYRSPFALLVANLERDLHDPEARMVQGTWPQCKGARHNQSSWQVASLGPVIVAPNPSSAPSLSGQNVRWVASAGCLNTGLKRIIEQVADNFGPVQVNSTCRSRSHNRRVGGAPRSYHLTGSAVDFRVRSDFGAVLSFLTGIRAVGGLKHYGSGVFHIDNGPRRTWGNRSWGKRKSRRVRHARR